VSLSGQIPWARKLTTKHAPELASAPRAGIISTAARPTNRRRDRQRAPQPEPKRPPRPPASAASSPRLDGRPPLPALPSPRQGKPPRTRLSGSHPCWPITQERNRRITARTGCGRPANTAGHLQPFTDKDDPLAWDEGICRPSARAATRGSGRPVVRAAGSRGFAVQWGYAFKFLISLDRSRARGFAGRGDRSSVGGRRWFRRRFCGGRCTWSLGGHHGREAPTGAPVSLRTTGGNRALGSHGPNTEPAFRV
jgi:hypothetical protein